MEYEIIREPFLFMETMELLYKHVNRVRFSSLWTPRHERNGTATEQLVLERLELLQTILDEVCEDVDGNDPDLRLFFEDVNREMPNGGVYLAKYLISAFMDFEHPGFEETVADILRQWQMMNQTGAWLQQDGDCALRYTTIPGSPGSLFDQIYTLDQPAEFRLRLFGALHTFPETLEKLAAMMRPLAARLAEVIGRLQVPVGEMAEYWLTSRLAPLEFLEGAMGPEAVAGAGQKLRIAISLMDANRIRYNMEHEPGRKRPCSYMYIGCCITVTSQRREHFAALDELSTILRGLSERKRLEALRQLARKRLYGLELAEILNMDRGNLSRLLTVLHEQGFLHQEKENQRTYYWADRAAVQQFFDRVISIIFD